MGKEKKKMKSFVNMYSAEDLKRTKLRCYVITKRKLYNPSSCVWDSHHKHQDCYCKREFLIQVYYYLECMEKLEKMKALEGENRGKWQIIIRRKHKRKFEGKFTEQGYLLRHKVVKELQRIFNK